MAAIPASHIRAFSLATDHLPRAATRIDQSGALVEPADAASFGEKASLSVANCTEPPFCRIRGYGRGSQELRREDLFPRRASDGEESDKDQRRRAEAEEVQCQDQRLAQPRQGGRGGQR